MQSTKAKVESYPAPAQLATQTDLSPHEVKAITEAVNPLIADAFALYVKTKNFHWHIYGSHFRDYHLLLDEHADAIFDSIDVMAERVRRIGGTTIRSISHISQLQTIEERLSNLFSRQSYSFRKRHMTFISLVYNTTRTLTNCNQCAGSKVLSSYESPWSN